MAPKTAEKSGKKYKVTIGFKSKAAMNNFIEDFEMSKNTSIQKDAKRAMNDIKNGRTTTLNAFLKKHGAKI